MNKQKDLVTKMGGREDWRIFVQNTIDIIVKTNVVQVDEFYFCQSQTFSPNHD